MKKITLNLGSAICLFLTTFQLHSQFTIYTPGTLGFPNYQPSAIAASSNNKILMGSPGGLAVFYDSLWHVYTAANSGLHGNSVLTIEVVDTNEIWIGGDGLSLYNGTTIVDTFAGGVLPNVTRALKKDRHNNLWIGGDFETYVFTGDSMINLGSTGPHYITSFVLDSFGNIWGGSSGSGLYKFNGTTWTVYNTSNSGIPSNNPESITLDSYGNLWIGDAGGVGGLVKFDGNVWTSYKTSNSNIPSNAIYHILSDTSDNIWMTTGSITAGLVKFNGNSFSRINTTNSNLPSVYITALGIDKYQRILVATQYNGVCVYNNNCRSHYTLYPDVTTPHNWWAVNQSSGTGHISYTWYWGDGASDTGSAPSHTFASPGNYNICLKITDSMGCSITYCDSSTYIYKTDAIISINVVDQLPTGINEAEANAQISIYPNPATDQLYIETNGTPVEQIKIYNTTGSLVSQTKQPQSKSIDISQLANGVYVAEIKTDAAVVRRRWVKM